MLDICALYDYRQVGASDVDAWFKVVGHLDYIDAVKAVTRHYAESTDRIMPAHVVGGVQ
ncbi:MULTISPECIES: hypothetical protein [unclassified Micromonospora]|uniref:hypothetical protein n=1 Tax=unclassified Micromonospora TaxID=2617518 RepID=UPI00331860DE